MYTSEEIVAHTTFRSFVCNMLKISQDIGPRKVLAAVKVDLIRGYSTVNLFGRSYMISFMSPLRRHIFVCFMAKSAFWFFFGRSSVQRGRTHIVLG